MSRIIVFSIVALFVATGAAFGDPRPFTFTTDTYPVGKGNWEFEQWVTWEQNGDENAYLFREEIEFGVADNFDLAIYVPNWRYEDTEAHSGTHFDSISVEGVVYFLNPVTDSIGLGLYNEISVGEDELAFETKLLVQKELGNWTLGYNLVLETELEGVFDTAAENEVEGVVENTFGASYAFGHGDFRAGGELVIESVFDDWDDFEATHVFAGPVFSYWGAKDWFVTVTPMVQLTSHEEEPDFQVRMIAGYQF